MAQQIDLLDIKKIQEIISIYNSLYTTFKPIFDEMNYNYNMIVSKNQWSKDDKAELDSQGRPAKAYNLLSNVVKHFSSIEGGTRKGIMAAPRNSDDVEMSTVVTKILDTLNYNVRFNPTRSRALIDAIIAKWGWIRTAWSYEDDPLGMLAVEAINPMQIMFQIGYSDITLKKCQYVLYTPDLTLDQIVNQYCASDSETLKNVLEKSQSFFASVDHQDDKKFISTALKTLINTVGRVITSGFSDETNQTLGNTQWFDPFTGKFKILELHERRTARRMMMYDASANKNMDVTDQVVGEDGFIEDPQKIKQLLAKYPNAEQPRWELQKGIWITTVIPALNIKAYDAPYAVQNGNFMFTPVFCYDFHADMSQTQSVIDELIDPQSDYNKRRSTMLEMLVRFSSVGYVVEDGVLDGFESDWETKKIGTFKRVKRGMLDRIKPEQYPHIPPELFRDAEESKLLIEYISNTPKSTRGISEGSNEPASLFAQKHDVATQMIQHIYDNLDEAIQQVGQNEWDNVQKFMTMPRILRITDDFDKHNFIEVNKPEVAIENGQVVKKVLNDLSVGKFDIVISQTPYGPTARELEFIKLVDLMKFAIEVSPDKAAAMLPVVIKASDSSYRADIMQALGLMGQQKDQQDQVQTAMAALQNAFQQLQLDKGRADVQGQLIDNQKQQVETQGKSLDNAKKQQELSADNQAQRIKDALNRYVQNNYASA